MKMKDLSLFFLLRYQFWLFILEKSQGRFPRIQDWAQNRVAYMLKDLPVRLIDELLGTEEGDDECDE